MHAYLTQSKVNLEFLPIPIPDSGTSIRQRRLVLSYNIKKASSLTGITRWEWELFEQGWVPKTDNEGFLRALAGTLDVKYDRLLYNISPLEAHFANTED